MAASAGGERKGWLPAIDEEMEEAVLAAVRADLERTHNESVHEVVPWFFDSFFSSPRTMRFTAVVRIEALRFGVLSLCTKRRSM